jgi:hypothetical protein
MEWLDSLAVMMIREHYVWIETIYIRRAGLNAELLQTLFAISAESAEVIVERPVLLQHEKDVLDLAGRS